MEAHFHHWKKKKKVIWTFYLTILTLFFFFAIVSSHLAIMTFFSELHDMKSEFAIASYKARIMRYTLAILTFFSELWAIKFWDNSEKKSQNCKFISHNSDFIPSNCEFVKQFWENSEFLRIAKYKLAIVRKKSELWDIKKLELPVYISILLLAIASLCLAILRKKTLNCEIKSRN